MERKISVMIHVCCINGAISRSRALLALDGGLDIFQRVDLNKRFRQVKAFEVTYLRDGSNDQGSMS